MLGYFRKKYINKVKRRINYHVELHFNEIESVRIQTGEMRYNERCFYNAAHHYFQNPLNVDCALVYCMEKGTRHSFLHVMNKSKSSNVYVENTLGYLHINHRYFYLKRIAGNELEGDGGYTFFSNYRIMMVKEFSSKFIIKLLGLKPVNFI